MLYAGLYLAKLLDLALRELSAAQRYMISVCSETQVVWCVHEAVAINNLKRRCAYLASGAKANAHHLAC